MACDLILVLDAPSPIDVGPVLSRLSDTSAGQKSVWRCFAPAGRTASGKSPTWGSMSFSTSSSTIFPTPWPGRSNQPPGSPSDAHPSCLRRPGNAAPAVKPSRNTLPIALLGVTVLTSLNNQDLHDVAVGATPEAQVLRLAQLGVDCGLKGLVCSPLEIKPLRTRLPASVHLVVPGIRPTGVGAGDDQSRVMTPADARAPAPTSLSWDADLQGLRPGRSRQAILAELESQNG